MIATSRPFVAAILALGLSLLAAVVGSALLLHEPPHATRLIVAYVALSGGIALLAGTAVVLLGMRYLPSLSLQVGAGSLVAGIAAIVTILYTPLLMFKDVQDLHLLVLVLICFLFISFGLAWVTGYALTRPLGRLREATRQIAAGRFDTRVEAPPDGEVAELAAAFNRMSGELGESFARQRTMEASRRDLVAAISHDLRTPLASIRAMLEAIEDRVVRDSPTIEAYHAQMREEVMRLGRLIDDLFELSSLETGGLQLELTAVQPGELIRETVESIRVQAERRHVVLQVVDGDDEQPLLVDAVQMQRVLSNLLQNALRHTPERGEITISTTRTGGDVIIEVRDSGEGIVPEDLPHVFDRFYRGEKSRSRQSGGAGLGLAISKAIVEAHRGRIWAESEPHDGSRFYLALPA